MKTTTSTAENRLEITRVIKAPRERVYTAWTDPEKLKQWFGPDGTRTRQLAADPRVGGKYQWDTTSRDGEEMTVRGEYRELIPNQKIVFTWKWDDDEAWDATTSIVTVELADTAEGTELRLTHEQFPSDASRDRHQQGWNSVVDQLTKFLNPDS
ncbi:MAG: SRPBCC domain-containing protein [Verrucomicrobiota bacterium]|nr:SRPBCC domain-containing protein [Verrucomicrobiota bacterium]